MPVVSRFRLRRVLVYFAFLSVGLWCALYPMLLSGFRRMEVNTGDTRLQNFFLEYTYRWMHGWMTLHPISLWDQPFFFPTRNVGAYSDILLGSAPIYWMLRVVQFAPDTAFQLWMMIVLIIDFASMILLLRNCLGFGPLASALGGFLFAFGAPRLAQLGHQQLLPHFFTMFALYGLFRFFEPRRMNARQGIVLFFLCFAAQLWAGFYLGWFLFLGLLALGVWTLCLRRPREVLVRHLLAHRTSLLAAASLFIVLVAPMAYHYLKAVREVGSRPFADIALMIPPPQSWLYLGSPSWLYSWQTKFDLFRSITYEHEQRLGIGWITLGLALAGFHRFQKRQGGWATRLGLAALTIVLLTTLFPGGWTPWRYLYPFIPGAAAVRALSREALLMLIPLSIGLAYLVETRKRVFAALAIAAICVLEQAQHLDAYDKLQLREDTNDIARRIGKGCEAFYYSPRYLRGADAPPTYELQIDAMWFHVVRSTLIIPYLHTPPDPS